VILRKYDNNQYCNTAMKTICIHLISVEEREQWKKLLDKQDNGETFQTRGVWMSVDVRRGVKFGGYLTKCDPGLITSQE